MHRLRPKQRGGVFQHLQPCSRRTVRHGHKKDGVDVGWVEDESRFWLTVAEEFDCNPMLD